MKIAVFPGSFDPITRGHESIIRRAIPLFDKIIVAIGVNVEKKSYFPLDKRLGWIKTTFGGCSTIEVERYSGLTVDFCRKHNARYLLRGLRTSADFEFERSVAQVNRKLEDDIETVFFLALPEYVMITSSIVRELHKYGSDIGQFVPEAVLI